MTTNRAIFLDKDGTLVEDVPYNVDPARMRLADGAVEGMRMLRDAGYALIVVSNQSGVARGMFDEPALKAMRVHLEALLDDAGVAIDGFYYCPHHPDGSVAGYRFSCMCRKPEPGMIIAAAEERGIDLASSWCIGDILDDIEAGHRADCRTALILNGNETEWELSPAREPHVVAATLLEAARVITGHQAAVAHEFPAVAHQPIHRSVA